MCVCLCVCVGRVNQHLLCLHFEQICLINNVIETQRKEWEWTQLWCGVRRTRTRPNTRVFVQSQSKRTLCSELLLLFSDAQLL